QCLFHKSQRFYLRVDGLTNLQLQLFARELRNVRKRLMPGKLQLNQALAASGIGIQSKNLRRDDIQNAAALWTLKAQADVARIKAQAYRQTVSDTKIRQ